MRACVRVVFARRTMLLIYCVCNGHKHRETERMYVFGSYAARVDGLGHVVRR